MTHLIDLTSTVERDTFSLDGKVYELRKFEELGPFEHERIVALTAKNQKFDKLKRRLTHAEEQLLSKAYGEILKLIVVDLDARALAKIEPLQRAKIVGAWAETIPAAPGAAEGEAQAAPTTGGSSRRSKRSTAATRKAGSTSRGSR